MGHQKLIAICKYRYCSYLVVGERKGRRQIEVDFVCGSSGRKLHVREVNEWNYNLCSLDLKKSKGNGTAKNEAF